MLSLTNYGTTKATADAWNGIMPAVHINLAEPGKYCDNGIGWIAISPDNARTLAHQLQVAAERVDAAAAAKAAEAAERRAA